jgi:hypothetical protein
MGQPDQAHHLKRVLLPNGWSIEVIRFPEEQDLHVCLNCGSQLVYPLSWEESGPENWNVMLRCPECEVCRGGVFSQTNVDAFDQHLDIATGSLLRSYKRLMRENMVDEVDRFAAALQADAVVPEDF